MSYIALPLESKNYMTPKGAQVLRDELAQLLSTERPKLVEVISWAASNGDRSENGDYIYGKRRLREIDRRIRYLTKRLDFCEIIDPLKQESKRVLFGATVIAIDEDDQRHTFIIVGVDEAKPATGKVSWISPIAKALLNSTEGDVVSVSTPKGIIEYEILEVSYQPID